MPRAKPFTSETAKAAIAKRWAKHRKPRWEARKIKGVPIEGELALLDNTISCNCERLQWGHLDTCPKIVDRGYFSDMIYEAKVRNRKEATQVESPQEGSQ